MTWWLLSFSRSGSASYLSHLDTARAMQRTFARAGVPIALSQGMRPKPRISLPLPLPVGAAGCDELAVVEVPDDWPAGLPGPAAALRKLRAAAPPGLTPVSIVVAGEQHPRPQPTAAEYVCVIDGEAGAITAAVERYESEESVVCERISPKGRRTFDLKEYVVDVAARAVPGGAEVGFTIRHRADGAARPQELVDLVAQWAGVEAAMRGLQRRRVVWKGLPAGHVPRGRKE